jgi:FG-GAP repeat
MSRTNWIRITGIAAIIAACSFASVASAATWTETDKLIASDGADGDSFGYAVSISGNTAIVGAYGDDDNGGNSGSTYIYSYNGSSWSQDAKLTSLDGAAGDAFGHVVSISGSSAIVGAPYDEDHGTYSGAAYIFENDGSAWSQAGKLTAVDAAANDFFGNSVSISGSTAIVGAYRDADHGSYSGSAYVFENDGSGWTQVAKFTASDAAASDVFGTSVSINGNTAVVGAKGDQDHGIGSGSAYVFENDGSGWTQVAKLTAADGAAGDSFGKSVSITDGIIIVGAWWDDDNGSASGSAYVFEDDGSGWSQVAKLTASDGASHDCFGGSVGVSDGVAIIGAENHDAGAPYSGSAYLYENNGSGWTQTGKFTASDADASDYFGIAVSISDGTSIVGAYGDDDNGSNSGSAYVFGTPSSEPVPEPMSMIFFGTGVVGVLGFVSRRKMQRVA